MNRKIFLLASWVLLGTLLPGTPAAWGQTSSRQLWTQQKSQPSSLPLSVSWGSKSIPAADIPVLSETTMSADLPLPPVRQSPTTTRTPVIVTAPPTAATNVRTIPPRQHVTHRFPTTTLPRKYPSPMLVDIPRQQTGTRLVPTPAPRVITQSDQPGRTIVYPERSPVSRKYYNSTNQYQFAQPSGQVHQMQPQPQPSSRRWFFNGPVARRISRFFGGSDDTEQTKSSTLNPYQNPEYGKKGSTNRTWDSTYRPGQPWRNQPQPTTNEPPIFNAVPLHKKQTAPRPLAIPPRTTTVPPATSGSGALQRPSLAVLRPKVARAIGPNVQLVEFRLNNRGQLNIKLRARTQKDLDHAFDRMYSVPGLSMYEPGQTEAEITTPTNAPAGSVPVIGRN